MISTPGQPVLANSINGLTGKDLMRMHMSVDRLNDIPQTRILNTNSTSGIIVNETSGMFTAASSNKQKKLAKNNAMNNDLIFTSKVN